MNNPSFDAGIPVLTEVIPPSRPSEPAPQSAVISEVKEKKNEEAVTLQQHATEEWDDERWDRLEHEIRERVLHQVLERIDFVLEHRVRDSLADVLQLAVENLASDVRNVLHHTMKEVISRVVAQEISRLQAARK